MAVDHSSTTLATNVDKTFLNRMHQGLMNEKWVNNEGLRNNIKLKRNNI